MRAKNRYKLNGVDRDFMLGCGLGILAYFEMRIGTRRRLSEVFYGVRILPYRFHAREVRDMIREDLAVRSYQPFLIKLEKCEYLRREVDSKGRTVWMKTELTKCLNDSELAADIVSKRLIIRFEKPKTKRKSGRSPKASQNEGAQVNTMGQNGVRGLKCVG